MPSTEGEAGGGDATRPRARIGRSGGPSKRDGGATRLAFLYSATGREPPDSLGHVAVARHRIVRQNARKIHVDCDPFDEDEWARRGERGGESSGDAPKTRTLAVDRVTLRKEGRFRRRHARRDLIFYASEQDGIRDVEAALTAKYAWCAMLGVQFPCSADSIKTAYRRLAMTLHPDAGGDPAEFRTVEQAYREALAYFAQADDASPPIRIIGRLPRPCRHEAGEPDRRGQETIPYRGSTDEQTRSRIVPGTSRPDSVMMVTGPTIHGLPAPLSSRDGFVPSRDDRPTDRNSCSRKKNLADRGWLALLNSVGEIRLCPRLMRGVTPMMHRAYSVALVAGVLLARAALGFVVLMGILAMVVRRRSRMPATDRNRPVRCRT